MNENTICPLCGNDNHCAMASGQEPTSCWCMDLPIPKELLDQVHSNQKGQSCVCQQCVENYLKQEKI